MVKVDIDIITCPEWNARQPKSRIIITGRSIRIIHHHTAGHHREIENPLNESEDEAIRYAQDIQAYHMDHNGWNDSGHNFLVCRNGSILQGRWHTVSAIQAGQMVISAHCPTQNTQIGVEHEHWGEEEMTPAQKESSARLNAWISAHYHRSTPLPMHPHNKYFPTACPANLKADIPDIRARAQEILNEEL